MSERRRPVDRPRRAALDVLTAVRVDRAYANLVLPQVLRNVPVATRGLDVGAALADEVAAEEARLGRGRVLLRPSGTEPVVRVMVEAGTTEQAEAAADRLATAVEELGRGPAGRRTSA